MSVKMQVTKEFLDDLQAIIDRAIEVRKAEDEKFIEENRKEIIVGWPWNKLNYGMETREQTITRLNKENTMYSCKLPNWRSRVNTTFVGTMEQILRAARLVFENPKAADRYITLSNEDAADIEEWRGYNRRDAE